MIGFPHFFRDRKFFSQKILVCLFDDYNLLSNGVSSILSPLVRPHSVPISVPVSAVSSLTPSHTNHADDDEAEKILERMNPVLRVPAAFLSPAILLGVGLHRILIEFKAGCFGEVNASSSWRSSIELRHSLILSTLQHDVPQNAQTCQTS